MQDREILFQMLANKDWDHLSEIIYQHKDVLKTDPIIQHAVRLFEQEFIGHVRLLSASDRLAKLRHITLIIESNRRSFATDFVNQAIDAKLEALNEMRSPAFVGYASQYLDRPLAKELLRRTQEERPEHLAEARRPSVSVKAAPTSLVRNSRITPLFKSQQEHNFYAALRKTFPDLLPYPNVALSTAVDFEAIKQKIDTEARAYFFKALFDCVVFDPGDSYVPLHFFELDSKFHDTAEAKNNDRLKNAICAAANIKLVRIRAFELAETTTEAFARLVKELIKNPRN